MKALDTRIAALEATNKQPGLALVWTDTPPTEQQLAELATLRAAGRTVIPVSWIDADL